MENTCCTKKQWRKSNALENQGGKSPSRMVIVVVKFYTVSDNANNTETVEKNPTQNASLSMSPETVSNRLDEGNIDNDGSY